MSLSAAAISPAEVASLRDRYPRAFSKTPMERAVLTAIFAGLTIFVVLCLIRFDA